MKSYSILFFLCCALTGAVYAQEFPIAKENLVAVKTYMSFGKAGAKSVVKVTKDTTVTGFDEATFVKLKDVTFKNGTIETRLRSKLRSNAPETARGFIGIAFRISEDNSKFECIYLRPANGRVEDQVRRNHSTQYFSYPDFKYDRLRKESPEKYESYADMGLNEWMSMKIVVEGAKAKLFVNGNSQPALIVSDLKLGADQTGGVGLFVDEGTEGFFYDVKVTAQ